jgi:RNA polymerase sigma factor (sigma-70 family)
MIFANKIIIPLPFIISESISGNSKMQKLLYQHFSDKMYAVCLRYTKNAADAEDILQEGFIKIFRNLDKFRGDGSFEGWIRKIITRTALSYLRDNKKDMHQTGLSYSLKDRESSILDKLAEKHIVDIVTKLPQGYRTIFMMYVVEGYNHREIATILGCSEGTCKSQLYRSKTRLQKMLKKTA